MLDQLLLSYERGLLVPFIGAGMSSPVCHLWERFVESLTKAAGLDPRKKTRASSDPVQRAAEAVRLLRFRGDDSLAKGVRQALPTGSADPLPQTAALAQTHWPLILTTNYDDLFIAAAADARFERLSAKRVHRLTPKESSAAPLVLVGRSPSACQRVLTSLIQPDDPILWALQGFVGGQAVDLRINDPDYEQRRRELAGELVVGHLEYRKVARAVPHFRRAFAEVFRSRSLFFLGAGLNDQYFLELFNEIIELYGPSPYPHFALMKKGTCDPDFIRQYFGIWVAQWQQPGEVSEFLLKFAQRVKEQRVRQTVWKFDHQVDVHGGRARRKAALRILRGPAPTIPRASECVVFSAGGSRGKLQISSVGKEILAGQNLGFEESDFLPLEGTRASVPIWKHRQGSFLAVNARVNPWTKQGARLYPQDPTRYPIGKGRSGGVGGRKRRDLRILSAAVGTLLDVAQKRSYRQIHCVLLAAGPLRTFPQSAALMEMVRGWSRWRAEAKGHLPRFSIYIVASEVLYDLGSGRLDIAACLNPEQFEFWLKIVQASGEEERYLCVETASLSVQELFARFGVTHDDWRIDLFPAPAMMWANWTLATLCHCQSYLGEKLSLERFGVRHGTTLRVSAPNATSD